MKIQVKSLFLGFVLAFVFIFACVAAAFLFIGQDTHPPFREQSLPSGKTVKVTSYHLVWGVEHDERHAGDDEFALEYVATVPRGDLKALDRETLEVFELIRPVSELWGFRKATVSAFPTVQRKGRYYTYQFKRGVRGDWTFIRNEAKVFVND